MTDIEEVRIVIVTKVPEIDFEIFTFQTLNNNLLLYSGIEIVKLLRV